MRCYLCGTRRARRRPWLSRTSAAPAAAAEGMVPCVVSRRPRWMRNPLPPLLPAPPPPPRSSPLGKDTAATAAPFAARSLDLIRSSLAPPEQKHHSEASPRTPIRARLPFPATAATTTPASGGGGHGRRRRAARVDSFLFRADCWEGTGLRESWSWPQTPNETQTHSVPMSMSCVIIAASLTPCFFLRYSYGHVTLHPSCFLFFINYIFL